MGLVGLGRNHVKVVTFRGGTKSFVIYYERPRQDTQTAAFVQKYGTALVLCTYLAQVLMSHSIEAQKYKVGKLPPGIGGISFVLSGSPIPLHYLALCS